MPTGNLEQHHCKKSIIMSTAPLVNPSWPWLEGCGATIADPIPPVTISDDRPSAKDLIAKHRHHIDQVRTELESDPLYRANKHDDLWILRFVMSHKNKVPRAVKAAKYTLAFREEHQLDAVDLRYLTPSEGFSRENMARYMKYCADDALLFTLPDAQRGVVAFACQAGFDQHALVQNVDEKDWLPCFLYLTEWSHQWLDYVTRTTGRLTKTIRIFDFSGAKISGINPELSRRDGKAMGVMEDCYPQLLQSLFICHAPAWAQIPWRIIRPLLPHRVASKIDFIAPHVREKERSRLLPYISLEQLPVRFGGTHTIWPVDFPLPSPK
jgi:CRAL/TRIO domain